ncbi:MAG: Spy/CpxP family protein refolding chaperone [Muribaculaceae bacterium]|nr:Spy/CpxP family protein refolding chaperone [Muribaculaceae bacterium]
MKKTLVTLSLAVATIFGFSAFAQQQDKTQCNKERTEKCCKSDKEKKCDRGQRPCFNPFEGIELSAEQQTKIDALKQECQAKRQEMKSDRKKSDDNSSKISREERMKQRQQSKRDYLAKVKAILTPDQYVTFLENMVVNNPGHDKGMKMDKRSHKGGKDFKQGDRRGHGDFKPQKRDNRN